MSRRPVVLILGVVGFAVTAADAAATGGRRSQIPCGSGFASPCAAPTTWSGPYATPATAWGNSYATPATTWHPPCTTPGVAPHCPTGCR